MTSYMTIFLGCIALWILSFFNVVTGGTALAFTVSWFILDLLGFFNKDKEYIRNKHASMREDIDAANGEDEEGLSPRAREFRRKLEEAKLNAPQAIMEINDPNGAKGQIVFRANGEIDVLGEVDPKVIQAAENLSEGIKVLGVEPIVEEFERQLQNYYAERDTDERD